MRVLILFAKPMNWVPEGKTPDQAIKRVDLSVMESFKAQRSQNGSVVGGRQPVGMVGDLELFSKSDYAMMPAVFDIETENLATKAGGETKIYVVSQKFVSHDVSSWIQGKPLHEAGTLEGTAAPVASPAPQAVSKAKPATVGA